MRGRLPQFAADPDLSRPVSLARRWPALTTRRGGARRHHPAADWRR